MANIEFYRMVQEDADGVARVEAACMPVPWSRQSFWEEASHTDAYYLIARDVDRDNLIVAYAGCWVLANEGHITNVSLYQPGLSQCRPAAQILYKSCRGRGDYVEYQALKRNIDKWRNYGRENYSCNRIKL